MRFSWPKYTLQSPSPIFILYQFAEYVQSLKGKGPLIKVADSHGPHNGAWSMIKTGHCNPLFRTALTYTQASHNGVWSIRSETHPSLCTTRRQRWENSVEQWVPVTRLAVWEVLHKGTLCSWYSLYNVSCGSTSVLLSMVCHPYGLPHLKTWFRHSLPVSKRFPWHPRRCSRGCTFITTA